MKEERKRKKERKEGEEEPCEPNSLSLMISKSRYSDGQKKIQK